MNLPSVSVLIPIKNEEKNIQNCLRQIANQTYEKNKLQVLIIDGNSEDNTRKMIEEFKAEVAELKIEIINDPKCQRSSAMNEGIRFAKGDIILRIDARTVIPEDYIEKCVHTLLQTGTDNVGGIQRPIENGTHNATQLAIGYAMSHPFGVGNAQFRLGKKSGFVDSVYLGCFWKKIFEKVGLFDETSAVITEDSDMNYRIRQSGGKVYLNKDIIAYYLPRERLSDLAKLYFRYGGARAGFLYKWKAFTGYRQLVPPIFLLTLIILPLISIFQPLIGLFWLLMVCSYVFADLCASLSIAKKNHQWKVVLLLMLIFPIMHFSWAAGFWRRVFQGNATKYWGY